MDKSGQIVKIFTIYSDIAMSLLEILKIVLAFLLRFCMILTNNILEQCFIPIHLKMMSHLIQSAEKFDRTMSVQLRVTFRISSIAEVLICLYSS